MSMCVCFRAKTISADCEEPVLQEKVIHSATQCAFATSQLVACARVVAPTIESNACQDQLTSAAKQVSHWTSRAHPLAVVDELKLKSFARVEKSL